MLKRLRWILFGLTVALFAIIVFRNLEETDLELVFATVRLPLAALLTITLLIGILLGLSLSTMWRVRSWRLAKSKDAKQSELK